MRVTRRARPWHHSPMNTSHGTARSSPAADGGFTDAPDLRLVVFALFFIFGGITSLNDVLIPKLKGLFTLTNGDVMLVQSAFFGAYFVISLPAASVVRKFGYMRTAVFGLLTDDGRVPLVHPGLVVRRLRRIPRRAVRAGGRSDHGSGGCESPDLDARAAAHGAQPADVRPGLQFARHDHLPLRGIGADPALPVEGRSLDARHRGEGGVAQPGNAGHREHVYRHCRGAAASLPRWSGCAAIV